MKNTIFKGMATALVTPMNENGVDYEAFGRLIDFQIDNGVAALLTDGTDADIDALILLYVEGNVYRLLNYGVGLNLNINLAVEEALLAEVLLQEFDVSVYDMIRELVATLELQSLVNKLFCLAL